MDASSKKWAPLFWPIMLLDFIVCLILKVVRGESSTPELQSVEVGQATDTHGVPRRSPISPDKFVSVYQGSTTIYEMTQKAVQKFGSRIAMQHYQFLELKKLKETDRFPSKVFSDELNEISYTELGDKLKQFGSGLRQLGMEPQPESSRTDFDNCKGKFTLVIFEDTCKEWTIALQGAMSQSMVVATCYATLGVDAVIAAVNETEATSVFVNWKQAEGFYKRASDMPTLTTIIASTHELGKKDKVWKPEVGSSKVQVVTYDEVLEMGKKNECNVTPPKVSL